MSEPAAPECQWWFLCDNQATTTEPHPAFEPLGVPICGDCKGKLDIINGTEAV